MSHVSSVGSKPAIPPPDDPAAAWPEYSATTLPGAWEPDILGEGFSYTTLPLGTDAEGEVCATLVRHRPPAPGPAHALPTPASRLRAAIGRIWPGQDTPAASPGRGHAGGGGRNARFVLVLHGWSDYFYNAELARYWTDRGYAFYALDLRRYGRSLRTHHLNPGYTVSLEEYDADLAAALEMIRSLEGRDATGICVAHSTGGLVASTGIVATLVAEPSPTTLGALLAQPAVLSVPVAFVTMILVSLTDPEQPAGTEETMLALHGPEGLGLEALRARG